jgi:hypothetical protein
MVPLAGKPGQYNRRAYLHRTGVGVDGQTQDESGQRLYNAAIADIGVGIR